MLQKSEVNATSRVRADKLLTESPYQSVAQRLGESFRAAGGVKKGADEIEALLHKRTQAFV